MESKLKIKKLPIFIGNKKVAYFYFDSNDKKIEKLGESFIKEYEKLYSFFSINPKKLIHLHFLYSLEEMSSYWGGVPPKSLSGMVDNDNQFILYVYSPSVIEKFSSEKKSSIIPVIIHETAHTFVSSINLRCFYWINEGICQLLESSKVRDNIIKKENWQWFLKNKALSNPKLEWLDQIKHEGYKIAYNLTKYILKKYKKEAIIDLIKIRRESSENIEEKMKKIFKSDLKAFLSDFEKNIKII
ncbi:MAG: hypothetical protein PHZ25_02640 [Candidatus Pacebacteria bacterium]|nr:hypothetical protein [Candidatus Paceibacterota bacterium]